MRVFLGGLTIFLVYLLVYSCNARAEGWHVIDLDSFDMESGKLINNADAYLGYADPKGATTEHWDTYTAAKFKLDLISYDRWEAFFDNTIEGASTSSQYREVAWAWKAGLDFNDKVQVFWQHRSAHVLDSARPGEHFPLFNAVLVNVNFYRRNP